ncbi:MAG: DUF421 domain-containing protein [bacterium]|nr:DUF421 domain-containing protein [bacterium]
MDELWYQIGITPAGALGVVIATAVLYLVFSAVIALWWRHFRTTNTSFAFALTVVLGAVMGRSMLGNTPTLVGGLIALVTLLLMESLADRVREYPMFQRRGRAVGASVVMVGGLIDHAELKRHGVRASELWVALRRAGVRDVETVGAVLLEADGAWTVLRSGVPVDRRILVGVNGTERLPDELLDDHPGGR